jgi:hypothetical protein
MDAPGQTSTRATSSPASSGPPQTPGEGGFPPSIQSVLASHDASAKVRAVRRPVVAGM